MLPDMNGEPTQRELYDAILNLQGAMLHGFNTLDGRLSKLETRMGGLERRMFGLESRFHEFDEDFQSFRVEVNHRFDRIDRQFVEVNGRLANLEAA
jgi:hypothetical protein